ncbi:hypothetical protein [Phenylobacterium sp.]|uniref:hypothetical protein n=1 Tax=Phenylobacterium sp. TaxID=1871053 RepID=UPI002731DF9C|nr:hypothetical protein [Phenylobacterium sp.]MDP1872993.1 hypothetical protein [Phenylobacterium sp.]
MIPRRLLLAQLGAAALAACDKPPVAGRPRLASDFGWNPETRSFQLMGEDLPVSRAWDFTANSHGFTVAGARARHIPGEGHEVTSESPDPILRSPAGLDIAGAAADLVLVRLVRRRAVGAWDGALYYATERHGETGHYMNAPLNGPPPEGAASVLVYDMTRMAKGGGDWRRSRIDQLRLDTATAPDDVTLISQIALARLV